MRAGLLALLMLAAFAAAASARVPAEADAAGCPAPGVTLASASGSRVFLVGSELYACWSETGRAKLLDTLPPDAPPEAISLPRIRGHFAAYALQKRVRLADISDGRSITFDSAPVALVPNRFGRIGWIGQPADGGFQVHRADLAGRDMILDEGSRIRVSSLTVRHGKLRWRNGSRVRTADFDGQRGDRAPIGDRHLRVIPGQSEVHGGGPTMWRFAVS